MKDLRYSKSHEWLDISNDDMKIGITDHAQDLLGDMVYIELPEVGREIVAGEEIGVLESVKAASDLYSPISGTIVETNSAVIANPSLLNSDPNGEGWLVKVRPISQEKLSEEIDGLLLEDEYLSSLTEEL